ncbi:patatin-like phospholipase family protein [Mesorhizobium sp. B4-1-4]|uniref:patatin-like phospholipase family protein n=1 Tax=Mesorhizobium sp. B4-1-4 TaxID=2589888 RepID=UPI00112788E9|nr:patatin-like phospholipase family protein [Mesorhizobium sp. B4-1-4]UCI32134.1 patatin-like phospholipase family protein [Mesorhizobium sp. B4-1-4]
MPLIDRITRQGKKKLLSIDGGGIRGVLALEILLKLENLLRPDIDGDSFRLSHYFDYIAGTSTGGIIAAGLSMGLSVRDIQSFYENCGAQMFVRSNVLDRLKYKFDSEPLAVKLKEVFGSETTLGSDKLQSLLLLVMRNATTDSPWPLSNNPFGYYNNPDRSDDNGKLPLWQLVRASTAAPTYFPPEVIIIPGISDTDRHFIFVDGGVTMYNNPTFQMFLMATVDRYWSRNPEARWRTGADQMLIVSVGTGTCPDVRSGLNPNDMNLLFNATTIPSALMFAASNEQDLLCRIFGECRAGQTIDREIGNLVDSVGPLPKENKLFAYVRYNAELTRAGLDALGLENVRPETVQRMDAIDGIPELHAVGKKAAERVKKEHFIGF